MNSPSRSLHVFAIAAVAGVFFAASADAATLLEFTFSGSPVVQTPYPAEVKALNVTGGNMTQVVTDSTNVAVWGFGGGRQSAYFRFDSVGTTSFTSDKYVTFTLTAAPGYTLNLNSLTFDLGGTNTHASATRTAYAQVRSDAETIPFSTSLEISPGVTVAERSLPPATSDPTYTNFALDLSADEFQGLTEITFRIYPYVSAAGATNAYWMLDNIVLDGTVDVVPEPSASLLLIVGGLVSMIRTRRRSLAV